MKNILVLTYWSFKEALIQTYTLPYLHLIIDQLPKGSSITLVTFEQKGFRMNEDEERAIRQSLKSRGIKLLTFQYHTFGFLSFFYWPFYFCRLLSIIIFKRIHGIHAWCTPAGSLGFILSKLTGRSLVVDSFEPHAEVMTETGTWSGKSMKFKLLFYFEKLQARHAKTLICCTESMADYCREKYKVTIRHQEVKPACVDLRRFSLANRKNPDLLKKLQLENKITCVYTGKFGGRYLEQEVFDFFKKAVDYWGDRFRSIILSSTDSNLIRQWAVNAKIPDGVIISMFVDHADIPDYTGLGDFAISPFNPVPSIRYSAPIKNSEYWALGLPVVITPHIANDSRIIEENQIGAIWDPAKPGAASEAIKTIDQLLKRYSTKQLYDLIRPVAELQRNYKIAAEVYKRVYQNF